jgi:hypothetical protein
MSQYQEDYMKDYWRMSEQELEAKASEYQLSSYWIAPGGPTPHIDRQAIISQLLERDKALSKGEPRTFSNITISGGSTVTFGDGSEINIATVTLGSLLQAVESAIETKVTDPGEKQSLLARLHELTRHPALTTVLQTTLTELLRSILK